MENPEEVLQALDEFQKMRPTEIPRELEEYLSWVAKTGDPVYQWSLIKALFREKLTRVMTDFYESCPSLDLAPCPNVETFNYDTMKSSLLERLESFASAPFTVQRICELLTAPRKEYNRVDKFMRAIEKNILVVSTKEPGSTIRRNENGDGLVNGSVEDDAPGGESHDVEMDSWVKDCTTSTVQTMDSEARLLDDVTTTVPKTGPATNGGSLLSQEKADHTSINTCETGLNFVPSTSEFSGQGLEARDSISSGLGTQGLGTTVVHETPSIAREVPDAIMNEDTSSQPSLDIDSPESEPADPNRKLQTTFQAKDFITHEKSPEPYEKETKVTEKTDQELEVVSETLSDESSSEPLETCAKLKQGPVLPNLLYSNIRFENSVITSEGTPSEQKPEQVPEIEESALSKEEKELVPENPTSTTEEQSSTIENSEPETFLPENIAKDKVDVEAVELASAPKEEDEEEENEVSMKTEPLPESEEPKEPEVEEMKEESSDPVIDTVKETSEEKSEKTSEDSCKLEKLEEKSETDESKPIITEESASEKCDSTDNSQDSNNSSLTIEETTEDDSSETKSMVPDPIPIIEEPKEVEPVVTCDEKKTSIEEIDLKSSATETENLPKNEPTIIETIENNDAAPEKEVPPEITEETKTEVSMSEEKQVPEVAAPETVPEKVTRPEESMEVDCEGEVATAGDEPMEEEVTQVTSS